MAIKVLVTGDMHLGKRSAQIDSDSDLLSAKSSWLSLVDYSVSSGVDMVVLTGDIVDRDNRYFEASGPLMEGFKILNSNNITTYIVAGNHDFDVLPQIVDMAALKNVHLLGRGGQWESMFFEKEGEKIQLIGWSFPSLHYRADPVANFPPDMPREGLATLLVVHGDVYSANSPYAPLDITKIKMLPNVDAILLGHIHKNEIFSESLPLLLYCGSPHALNPKERGLHGPYIMTIAGNSIEYEMVPLSPVRYEELRVDVSEVTDEESFRKSLHHALKEFTMALNDTDYLRFLSIDVVLTGTNNKIKEIGRWSGNISDLSFREQYELSVRKVCFEIEPRIDIDSLLNNPSYLGILANAIKDIRQKHANTFVETLKKRWIERYAAMSDYKTYYPLELTTERDEMERKAEESVLRECENLLTRLFIQSRDES